MNILADIARSGGEGPISLRILIAAAGLCAVGIAVMAWCVVSGYEVLVPLTGEGRTTGMASFAGTSTSERDITSFVTAVAAASFAASLVVSAVVLPNIRTLKLPIMLGLLACFALSATGLFFLVFSF